MQVMTTENTAPVVGKIEYKTFPILTPSSSYRGAVAMTLMSLIHVARILKREVVYIQGDYKGYVFAVNNLFHNAKKVLHENITRGMIIEDDIYFSNPDKLIDAIKTADENNWNIVAPYRVPGGLWTITDDEGAYTDERKNKLKDWDVVKLAGLGFYYGDIPLDYEFTEVGKYQGHDLNFYNDNNIELRYVDFGLKHIKTVML